MNITRDNVADALNELLPLEIHCSNLASDALKNVMIKYHEKQKK